MKNAPYSFLLVCLIALLGCSKEAEFIDVEIPLTGPYLQAKVDGQWVSFSNFNYAGCDDPNAFGYRVYTRSGEAEPSSDHLSIQATTSDGKEEIEIVMKGLFLWKDDFPLVMESKMNDGDHIQMLYKQEDTAEETQSLDIRNGSGKFILESWKKNAWLVGTFTTELASTNRRNIKQFEEGRFRIKVKQVDVELD